MKEGEFEDPPPHEKAAKKVKKKEEKIERKVDRAVEMEEAGDLFGAEMILDAAMEEEINLKGDKFESKVASETRAKEMSVVITCRDCGITLAEYDVVTEDGVVKECKASWGQVKEEQFLREQAIASRPEVFGPGTVVHLAVPKGLRGRLDRKFSDKSIAAGKIQEH